MGKKTVGERKSSRKRPQDGKRDNLRGRVPAREDLVSRWICFGCERSLPKEGAWHVDPEGRRSFCTDSKGLKFVENMK